MVNFPRTESEFLVLMEELDESLRKRNIPIPARPLRGAGEIAKRFEMRINLLIKEDEAIPNNYTGDSFAAHIFKWFNERYGENLKKNFGPGKAAILIKNDPYRIVFPKIFGSPIFICDRNIQFYKERQTCIPKIGDPIIPLNVLLYEEGTCLSQLMTKP